MATVLSETRTFGQVVKLLTAEGFEGVPHRIRFAQQTKKVCPQRDGTGNCHYSEADVQSLREILTRSQKPQVQG